MKRPSYSCTSQMLSVLAVLAALGSAVWADPPETINVHGSLLGADSTPLAGPRVYVVRFFDAETDGTQLGGDLTGMVEISAEGLFNLPVVLPPEALAAAELWYELGIDSDDPPDLDASDDVFPERIRVHSVPFALEANEVTHLDADRIGDGSVDDTEFGYLDGVTEPVQTALDAKADDADLTAHESDTGNPHTVMAVQVGLGNVDNTADLSKPISSATQSALDAKADDADLTAHESDMGNPHTVTAAQVGLGNVDNTSDLGKPVSTATQTALNAKANATDLTAHTANTTNPHAVTKAQVGLGNVDNTADANKPVSTAAQAALDEKLPRTSEAYVLVEVGSDVITNGTRLREAYAAAKALTPFGSVLSADNRAVVLVPPGSYDLSASPLAMDTDYVDVVGLSTARDDQYIYHDDNVLIQTASDVRIENLVFHYTGTNVAQYAYLPDVTWDDGTSHTGSPPETRIRNCEFRASDRSMRTIAEYAGIYEDCIAGGYQAFGGYHGTASGTFINCTGGLYAFGGYHGTASGTFVNCTGGLTSFGGGLSTASGTFIDCTGEDYAFGGDGSVASGTFINCTAGNYAFGGGGGDSTGGSFYGCRMTGDSYAATFTGRMENCWWGCSITCGDAARIYRSTILGFVDLDSSAAGIAYSSVRGTIQNAGSAVFNTANLESLDVN